MRLYTLLYGSRNELAAIAKKGKPDTPLAYEPFRLYCHCKMLSKNKRAGGRKELLDVLRYMNGRIGYDKNYFYSAANFLLECLGSKTAIFSQRIIQQQLVQLVLNFWDAEGAKKLAGDMKYIRVSKIARAILIPKGSEFGVHPQTRGENIIGVHINPAKFLQSLRKLRGFERVVRPTIRSLPQKSISFKWRELQFVPEGTRGEVQPEHFGKSVYIYDDPPPIFDWDDDSPSSD